MKTLLAWLFGTVTARITGAQPEDFLNLCARENLVLWRMVQRDLFTLEVQVTARQYARRRLLYPARIAILCRG